MNGPRRGLGLGTAAILGVVIVGVALASGLIPFRQVFAQERSMELAIAQRDALTAENRHLEQQITALQTRGEVERLAREQFGMIMPGEIAYVAVPVEDTSAATPLPTETFAERESWWQRLWDFVTGRDLGADGRP